MTPYLEWAVYFLVLEEELPKPRHPLYVLLTIVCNKAEYAPDLLDKEIPEIIKAPVADWSDESACKVNESLMMGCT